MMLRIIFLNSCPQFILNQIYGLIPIHSILIIIIIIIITRSCFASRSSSCIIINYKIALFYLYFSLIN